MKDDYIHFINGSKPAYICENDDPEFGKLISSYPSAPVLKGKTTIFFHSAEERDEFSKKMMGIEIPSADYFRHLGIALGYPPVAVNFFVQYFYNRDLERYAASFAYAGRHFGGHIDDAASIVQWLWSNVKNFPPSEVRMTYQSNDYRFLPPATQPVKM